MSIQYNFDELYELRRYKLVDKDAEELFNKVADSKKYNFSIRNIVENDLKSKQIISYQIVLSNDGFFVFKRNKKEEINFAIHLSVGFGEVKNSDFIDDITINEEEYLTKNIDYRDNSNHVKQIEEALEDNVALTRESILIIQEAVCANNIEVVKYMISKGTDLSIHEYAFGCACSNNMLEIIELFVANGLSEEQNDDYNFYKKELQQPK